MDIPIKQSESPDIFNFGFDKKLNRSVPDVYTPAVYSSVDNLIPVENVNLKNMKIEGIHISNGATTFKTVYKTAGEPVFHIIGGNGFAGAQGGRVTIEGGTSSVTAGQAQLLGGRGEINGNGGAVNVQGGSGLGTGNGGNASIAAGSPSATGTGTAGITAIGAGSTTAGTNPGGNITITGGASTVAAGGDIIIKSGSGSTTTNFGVIRIRPASSQPDTVIQNDRATTTDATQTTAFTLTLTADTMVMIEAIVAARRTGGTGGTNGDSAGYKVYGTYKKVGAGAATLVGAVSATHTAEDQAAWDATFTTSGNNVRLSVTGALNNNISWNWLVSYIITST